MCSAITNALGGVNSDVQRLGMQSAFEVCHTGVLERIPHNQMKEMPFESGAGLAM